jgi:glyoxylase-like metal-dependent hydrolase (beta-lactamase superfamily II)
MSRIPWLVLFSAAALSGCAAGSAEQQAIDRAAAALGGRDRIAAVKTLLVSGEGTAYSVGSDQLIDTNQRTFRLTGYKQAIDVVAARALVEQTRTPNTPNFAGQAPARQVQGIDGEVAYNVAANGNRTPIANEVTVVARRANIYHHPLTIVRAALDPAAVVANARTEGNETLVDVTTASGVRLRLGLDTMTGLPTRVVSTTAGQNILGDVDIETSFADYRDVNGLILPARLERKTDRFRDFAITVATVVDGETGDLAAPAGARSAPAAGAAERSTVAAEEIAKGIWHLTGTTHHSVLVEFADHLTLIEAPNEDRALGIFAKARELRPDKPLTTLINTHHHFDHSAGVRAAASEGLTIVTHKSNAAFYRHAVTRPRTILPDTLSENPNPPVLELVTVDEEMTLSDPSTRVARSGLDEAMTLVMYRIANNTHADNNLMIYFPRERLLVQADIFMPRDPRTLGHAPWVSNLRDNIEARKLSIDRHVPLHGRIVPHSEFLQVVKDGYDRTVVKEPPAYRYSPS